MKLLRAALVMIALAALAGVAYVSQAKETPGTKMTGAAQKWLETLNADQKSKAAFAFDSKERTNWHFVPMQDKDRKPTRKGLPLEEMNAEQKRAAMELLRAGTSMAGYDKATTIMSLESILAQLEKPKGTMVRDPQWYFFTLFGTPSKTGKWGWRVEGHHLSLNFTLEDGKVISSTPTFFGANPATVKAGDRKGLRTLPQSEDLARELFLALDEEQKKVAHRKPHDEIEQAKPKPTLGAAEGLAAAKMTEKQRGILMRLLEAYTNRMPAEIGQEELRQLKDAGVDKIHFAYGGEPQSGKPHTYRIQGPTFLVEFLNVQPDSDKNPANHIHSCWRNVKGDFGLAAK